MKFSRTLMTAAAAAIVVTLAGCAGTGSSDSGGSAGEAGHAPLLNLGMVDAPGQPGFVAADMSLATLAPYGQAVYDSLMRATPDNELEPHLATEWSYDDTRTVLTLTLRDDIVFTDGTQFTADIAAQNLIRYRDGNSQTANQLAALKDATAIDDTTLQITLSAPDPALLLNLSGSAGFQEAPASFDDPSPVGTGPYILDEEQTVADSTYVFSANESYWAPALQHYDQIVMTVFKDAIAMKNALAGDQLDAALYVGFDGYDQIVAAGYTEHASQQDWAGLILFDRTGVVNPAMGDVRVRQAINFAIDREGMLQALAGGRGDATTQVFNKDTTGYDAALEEEYPFDPDKAKQLLKESGHGAGLEIVIPTTSFVPPAFYDLLTQQLSDVGITAVLDERSPAEYIPDLLSGRYAVAGFTLQQPPTAWETYQLVAAPSAPWNATHQTPDEVLALGQILQTGSEEEADAAASDLNAYLVENAWFNPWYRLVNTFYTDAETDVTTQVGWSFPFLWNIVPK